MNTPFSYHRNKEEGLMGIHFLINAWSVHLGYWAKANAYYWHGITEENGGRFWGGFVWRIELAIHQRNPYERHLMAIMGMMTGIDGRKWKGPGENRLENWSKRFRYGQIREIQRQVKAAHLALHKLSQSDSKRGEYECLIEHHTGTLEYIREQTA